ncbi:sporulation integral membrane protein YlbJ [Fontibacillus phaseoli]|uniref:Sporulation integral membrane protein YlbJ n=1 Tax=Fontibacillus phaseoli TaxID=1416533 RepID=A0A369BLN2_9BACL|nr:nucleoside recognition domain-containing protein [Fontibacillus phaseoli]RCX21367.1 sporulation integral membrane protein YlbJ [Fontibacillus phaseoli]
MQSERRAGGSLPSTLLFGLSAVLLVVCIFYAPGEAFQASGQGLAIWWRIVFPALLPFLVLSEILLASGFAQGIGVLLEPLTRKVLGLPGSFGWVFPLGITAGFPASATAAANLYKQGKISSLEAEKMASVAHFSSPMLLVIVIGTGYMGLQELGFLLLAVHWISGLAAGMTLHLLTSGIRSRHKLETQQRNPLPARSLSRLRLAANQMEEARAADGRGFGKLLGDAVGSSVQTLMTVGGYMLIFAVVIHVLISALPGFIPSFSIAGLLEVHLGTYAVAQLSMPPAIVSALLGAVLGWSGFCAFLQVRSILKPAGIGSRFFVVNRLIHGAYAYVITLLLWRPLSRWLPEALPVSANSDITVTAIDATTRGFTFLPLPDWKQIANQFQFQMVLLLLLIAGLFVLTRFRKKGSR